MKKLKVSFDFDGTLHIPVIKKLAEVLLDSGADVWIVTARFNDWAFDENQKRIGNLGQNTDLRALAAEIGIDNDNIIYTNGALKSTEYFKGNFDLHYDDDYLEVEEINRFGGNAVLVDMRIPDLKSELINYS